MFKINYIENWVGCLISGWISLAVGFLTWIVLSGENYTHSHIFSIGPSENLFILGICIDTFPKYGMVASFCFVNSGMRVMNTDVLHSWMINEIQDTKNKNAVSTGKAYGLSFISVVYNWFDFFMYMNILMSQIDMLLIEIGADLIVTGYLTSHYLKVKREEKEEES